MVFDRQGRCLTSNRQGFTLMGCSADKILGKKFSEIWPKDTRPTVERAIKQVLKGKECSFQTDKNIVYGTRKELCWDISLRPVFDKNNTVKNFIAIANDITGHKQTMDELKKLKLSIESISTGVTIADTNGTILYTNPAEALMHGYKRDELLGKNVSVFSPFKRTKKYTVDEIKRFKEWAREVVNVRKNGAVFPIQLKSVAVKDSKGVPVGIITISEDITERKKAEEKLKYYTKQLEEYTAELKKAEKQLKEANLETIHALTKAAEYRDEDTAEHIKRIGLYSKMIAEAMGFDKGFCELMLYASPMHDVGKIGIPDSILLKSYALNEQEFAVMKQHTVIGSMLLQASSNNILITARDIALCHHERWDGTGYPRKLKGEQIPISARIVILADQYDALRSDRPYRKGLSHKKAASIILAGDGRTMPGHFDPEMLNTFGKIKKKFDEIFNENSKRNHSSLTSLMPSDN